MEYFRSFTTAYLSETRDILKKEEIDNLVLFCKVITLELAMRFLNDYINGDTYFKCNYENHNLVRCCNQLKLVSGIEKNYDQMIKIVKEEIKVKTLNKIDKH